MRAYTLAEIDHMRQLLLKLHPHWQWGYGPDGGRETLGMYNDSEWKHKKHIEEMLRTYMTGGIDPTELESAIDAPQPPSGEKT